MRSEAKDRALIPTRTPTRAIDIEAVVPAKAGTYDLVELVDPRFRRGDERMKREGRLAPPSTHLVTGDLYTPTGSGFSVFLFFLRVSAAFLGALRWAGVRTLRSRMPSFSRSCGFPASARRAIFLNRA